MERMKKLNMEAIVNSFRTRSFAIGGYTLAATAIVVAIAVAVNVLMGALPVSLTQWDTTDAGLFTLSEETETLVGGVEEDIAIYWIVQSGYEDAVLEKLLDRYKDLSDHITVKKIDPDMYPTFIQQYVSDGVYNNSLIVERGERYRYIGNDVIYVTDYSNYYTNGTYTTEFAGEAELTSAIDYVTREFMPKLYTLTGHGETSLPSGFSSGVEKQNFVMEELSLLTSNSVPADADGLLIYAPQKDISDKELMALRDYMNTGGKLYLISQPTQERLENLEAVLADYGVTAVEGIVVEGNQGYYAWGTPYDLLPDLGYHDITNALSRGGYYVRVPIAQGLLVEDVPSGVTVTELLISSDSAFSKPEGYAMTDYTKDSDDIDGPFALAVAVEESATGAAAVWVTSGYLADAQTNAEVSGANLDFFLNGLNWLCCGEESTYTIHAKSVDYSYLTMDGSTAGVLMLLVVVIIPAAFLGVGVVIWYRRRRV